MNKQLFEYLESCWNDLESSRITKNDYSSGLSNLYFATTEELCLMRKVEKLLHYNFAHPLDYFLNPFAVSLTQKNQNDILSFRSYFDEALAKKKVASIIVYPFPEMENLTNASKALFISKIEDIENKRGELNALLSLRNWAFFPDNQEGSQNLKRLAGPYLKMILSRFEHIFADDYEMCFFLSWCRKRTRKIFSWGIKEKDLRTPPTSVLPIYVGEAAAYARYFLQKACDPENSLRQQFAEMAIYYPLCFACSQKYSNQFKPAEILQVNKNILTKVSFITPSMPVDDIREQSKGKHEALQLKLSEDFLNDDRLWPRKLSQRQEHELDKHCKAIIINNLITPISHRLALAIEFLGKFSLTETQIENRLQQAFKIVGLSQSSGGISPLCLLKRPHFSKNEDLRELGKPKYKTNRDPNTKS